MRTVVGPTCACVQRASSATTVRQVGVTEGLPRLSGLLDTPFASFIFLPFQQEHMLSPQPYTHLNWLCCPWTG